MIPGESVVHARFGVEKVIGTVNIQLLKRRSGAVEIVVGARNVMPDETVLQVGIEVQPPRSLPVDLGEDVGIVLGRRGKPGASTTDITFPQWPPSYTLPAPPRASCTRPRV